MGDLDGWWITAVAMVKHRNPNCGGIRKAMKRGWALVPLSKSGNPDFYRPCGVCGRGLDRHQGDRVRSD